MLLNLILSTLLGIGFIGIRIYTHSLPVLAPDFETYRKMSEGKPAPDPFRLRWLLPKLMPADSLRVWKITGYVGLLLSFPAMYLFADTSGYSGLWVVIIWGSLPIVDVLWRMRGTIDHIAWPMALIAATVLLKGWNAEGIVLVLVCGMLDPRVPVFVASWTLNPLALLGLIPVVIAALILPKCEPYIHPEIIKQPWSSARRINGIFVRDIKAMLLPWGVCMAGFASLDMAVIVSLLLGYAQMFRAIDRVRLYMWAAPVLILATLRVVPEEWLPLAVIVTLLNPWRSKV